MVETPGVVSADVARTAAKAAQHEAAAQVNGLRLALGEIVSTPKLSAAQLDAAVKTLARGIDQIAMHVGLNVGSSMGIQE